MFTHLGDVENLGAKGIDLLTQFAELVGQFQVIGQEFGRGAGIAPGRRARRRGEVVLEREITVGRFLLGFVTRFGGCSVLQERGQVVGVDWRVDVFVRCGCIRVVVEGGVGVLVIFNETGCDHGGFFGLWIEAFLGERDVAVGRCVVGGQ